MCKMFLQTPNTKVISVEYFSNAFKDNSHGCGYMFVEDKRLKIVKSFWDWSDVYENYVQDHYVNPSSHFAVHFRQSSGGWINDENCHPHTIKPNKWALIHKGILPLEDRYPSQKSDSLLLAEKLSVLSDDRLANLRENVEITNILGEYNSCVIMGVNAVIVLNEHLGHWQNNGWFSG